MKTLVLGASSNPDRYSNKALNSLLHHGHEVVAVGRKDEVVSGVTIHKEKVIFPDVDTLTLYLNPANQKEYYDYIIRLKPRRVLFNPGTENSELQQLLLSHHIAFEEACTLVLLATNQF